MLLSEQYQCSCVFLQCGWTGLHVAARDGHCNVASALLKWGAEVDAVTTVSSRYVLWLPCYTILLLSLVSHKFPLFGIRKKCSNPSLLSGAHETQNSHIH